MIIDGKCKFCSCTLHLVIDDEYHAQGDPFHLLALTKLAACNRCSDLRERRRLLHERLIQVCANLIANPKDEDTRSRARDLLEPLTKKYVKLISEWTGQQLVWEEDMVSPFIAAPKAIGKHLRLLWGLTKQQQLGVC